MGRQKLTPRMIAEKLVATYPDAIEDIDGNLNFDATCDNLAECIMRDFDIGRQSYYFGTNFESINDCIRYVRNSLYDIAELCQEFLDERYADLQTDL